MPFVELDGASLVQAMREAMYGTEPEMRLDALRKLAADAGNGRSETQLAQTTQVLARVAEFDENEVLREVALGYLAGARSDDAFEEWFRIGLPAGQPVPQPTLAVAARFADGLRPSPLNGFAQAQGSASGDRLRGAQRALRVAAQLRSTLATEPDEARAQEIRQTILRLAERAILDSENELAEAEARRIRAEVGR